MEIYLDGGNNPAKVGLIPKRIRKDQSRKACREESAAHQLVGEVMAYQGYDG